MKKTDIYDTLFGITINQIHNCNQLSLLIEADIIFILN